MTGRRGGQRREDSPSRVPEALTAVRRRRAQVFVRLLALAAVAAVVAAGAIHDHRFTPMLILLAGMTGSLALLGTAGPYYRGEPCDGGP